MKTFIIRPYTVGKDKRSLAMVLPSEIVRSLRINPMTVFLLLQVKGADKLELKIIREEDLLKKDEMSTTAAVEKFSKLTMQDSTS